MLQTYVNVLTSLLFAEIRFLSSRAFGFVSPNSYFYKPYARAYPDREYAS